MLLVLVVIIFSGCGSTQVKIKISDSKIMPSSKINNNLVSNIKSDENGLKSL